MRERPTKRYIVRYQDESGPSGIIEWWCFAFDALHAEEMFYEGIDSDGWEVVSVDRPKLPCGKVDTQYDRPRTCGRCPLDARDPDHDCAAPDCLVVTRPRVY